MCKSAAAVSTELGEQFFKFAFRDRGRASRPAGQLASRRGSPPTSPADCEKLFVVGPRPETSSTKNQTNKDFGKNHENCKTVIDFGLCEARLDDRVIAIVVYKVVFLWQHFFPAGDLQTKSFRSQPGKSSLASWLAGWLDGRVSCKRKGVEDGRPACS